MHGLIFFNIGQIHKRIFFAARIFNLQYHMLISLELTLRSTSQKLPVNVNSNEIE